VIVSGDVSGDGVSDFSLKLAGVASARGRRFHFVAAAFPLPRSLSIPTLSRYGQRTKSPARGERETMKRASHRAIGIVLAASASLLALASSAAEQNFVPVTDAMLANPDPADWLMVSRTYDEHRYSPLNQITKANVSQLRMAWARSLPVGTQESTPLVYRGVMYLFAPGATIQAVDATNGDLLWEYTRPLSGGHRPDAGARKEYRYLRGHDLFRSA
jgi:glucose dehydrogenase